MAEALYRKYRPQVFDDVVGQDGIEDTLKAAIAGDKISHAYMFCGPRGTGKTTTARLVAKALLCTAGPGANPDGTCEECLLVANGAHPDVYELDAASRTGVDNVREEIISRVAYAPMRGRYKIYIIDEVHMLSTAAFNALLKTLEEPPDHVIFIMCTTDPQKVPATIHSRCQRFDFKSIDDATIAARLAAVCEVEGIDADADALAIIAARAKGGMRDALTNLEQASTFGRGKIDAAIARELFGTTDTAKLDALLQAVLSRDMAACYRCVDATTAAGIDCARFAADFAAYVRTRYIDVLEGRAAGAAPADVYAYILRELANTLVAIKTSTDPALDLELFCVAATHPQTKSEILALSARVAALEAALNGEGGEGVSEGGGSPRQASPAQSGPVQVPLPQAWALLLSDIKSQSTQVGMLLDKARPSTKNGNFILKFQDKDEFYYKSIQNKNAREMICAALTRIYGAPKPLAYELVENAQPADSRKTAQGATMNTPAPSRDNAPDSREVVSPTSATSTSVASPEKRVELEAEDPSSNGDEYFAQSANYTSPPGNSETTPQTQNGIPHLPQDLSLEQDNWQDELRRTFGDGVVIREITQ